MFMLGSHVVGKKQECADVSTRSVDGDKESNQPCHYASTQWRQSKCLEAGASGQSLHMTEGPCFFLSASASAALGFHCIAKMDPAPHPDKCKECCMMPDKSFLQA